MKIWSIQAGSKWDIQHSSNRSSKNNREKGKFNNDYVVVVVQLLNHVQLFATPWTAACQGSLCFTLSLSLLKLMSIVSVMPSNHLILCHPLLLTYNLSQHQGLFQWVGSFPMSWLFISGGESIGGSASASVLPMDIQDWFPLGWTGWISLLSKVLSRVFYSIIVWRYQFFGSQPFLLSGSHIYTWLLQKPWLRLYEPLQAK